MTDPDGKKHATQGPQAAALVRSLFEAAPDASIVVDLAGHIVLVNDRAEMLLGYAREELLGEPIEILVPDRFRSRHPAHREGYLRNPRVRSMGSEADLWALRKDGIEVPVDVALAPLTGEDGPLVYVSVRDATDRKRLESARRESDERLRRIVDNTSVIPWEADAETWRFTFVGPQAVEILGYPLDEWDKHAFWEEHIHPEDREYAINFCRESSKHREQFDFEYRMLSSTGEVVWLHDLVSVSFEAGEPKLLQGFMLDITERKSAEQALDELSGRLIQAQEDERRRIARELHDDVSQRLALLSIDLDLLGASVPSPEDLRERTARLTDQVRELSSEIHGVAYRLHPAKLEQLGLTAAVEGLCNELAAKHGLRIKLEHHEPSRPISREVALCLYRVVQEALQNVVKHSGADEARVQLLGSDDEIHLRIEDPGVGFDPSSPQAAGGIGLASMRERLRLVAGEISIESGPSCGTQVEVRVPLTRYDARR